VQQTVDYPDLNQYDIFSIRCLPAQNRTGYPNSRKKFGRGGQETVERRNQREVQGGEI
jgi:hypothetical protein